MSIKKGSDEAKRFLKDLDVFRDVVDAFANGYDIDVLVTGKGWTEISEPNFNAGSSLPEAATRYRVRDTKEWEKFKEHRERERKNIGQALLSMENLNSEWKVS